MFSLSRVIDQQIQAFFDTALLRYFDHLNFTVPETLALRLTCEIEALPIEWCIFLKLCNRLNGAYF